MRRFRRSIRWFEWMCKVVVHERGNLLTLLVQVLS